MKDFYDKYFDVKQYVDDMKTTFTKAKKEGVYKTGKDVCGNIYEKNIKSMFRTERGKDDF